MQKDTTLLSFQALLDSLFSKVRTRRKPTLSFVKEGYEALLDYFKIHGIQEPHYIQVLGTNGKGSTSTYIATLCNIHGYRTGLFTSPHIVNIEERIMIQGTMCSRDEWVEANLVLSSLYNTDKLLFFEHIFLLAIYLFSKHNVDIAVMEAGLGGKYDATTILPSCIQCFTTIQYDHEHILGGTLYEIAEQKASAIHPLSTVISVPQEDIVYDTFMQYAPQGIVVTPSNIPYRLGLLGEHQQINAGVAHGVWLSLCELLGIPYESEKVEKAFRIAYIPARLELIPYSTAYILLDGAHNKGGMETLYTYCKDKKILGVIYSTVYREGMEEIINLLEQIAGESPLYYYEMQSSRAVPYNIIRQYSTQFSVTPSIKLAVASLQQSQGYIVICGSLYLLGSFYNEFPELYYLSK